jgi:hypothetical protein
MRTRLGSACKRAYTHIYMHTYTHIYIYTHTHPYTHACIHTYIYTYTHARIHTCVHTHISPTYIHICLPVTFQQSVDMSLFSWCQTCAHELPKLPGCSCALLMRPSRFKINQKRPTAAEATKLACLSFKTIYCTINKTNSAVSVPNYVLPLWGQVFCTLTLNLPKDRQTKRGNSRTKWCCFCPVSLPTGLSPCTCSCTTFRNPGGA